MGHLSAKPCLRLSQQTLQLRKLKADAQTWFGRLHRLAENNPMDYNLCMLGTIVELPEFSHKSKGLLGEDESKALINYLAANPRAGVLMQGTGGIRKLRWARGGRGKSAGVRIVYYYHSDRIPLFLLSIFAKNEKQNLTVSERSQLAELVKILVKIALEFENV